MIPIGRTLAVAALGASSAFGATYTFSPTNPGLSMIDEEAAVFWALPTFPLPTSTTVTRAVLSFTGIRHLNTDANTLHFNLVDTPLGMGFSDLKFYNTSNLPAGTKSNWFAEGGFTGGPGQAVTALGATFTDTNPSTAFEAFSFAFNPFDLGRLNSYLRSAPGNDPLGRTVGIGFDSDGWFDVEGLSLQVTVPDAAPTFALLLSGLTLTAFFGRFARGKAGKP